MENFRNKEGSNAENYTPHYFACGNQRFPDAVGGNGLNYWRPCVWQSASSENRRKSGMLWIWLQK